MARATNSSREPTPARSLACWTYRYTVEVAMLNYSAMSSARSSSASNATTCCCQRGQPDLIGGALGLGLRRRRGRARSWGCWRRIAGEVWVAWRIGSRAHVVADAEEVAQPGEAAPCRAARPTGCAMGCTRSAPNRWRRQWLSGDVRAARLVDEHRRRAASPHPASRTRESARLRPRRHRSDAEDRTP